MCSRNSELTILRTLSQFHGEDIYLSSLFHGIGIFLFSFLCSMALGVAFGLMCSLGLKHSHLSSYPAIESCIVALVAYTSYFFSNGVMMSGTSCFDILLKADDVVGIVSLLFCGITLKHYAYHIMSTRTQRTTKYMFAVLAQLSENFIFIYLGLNLFMQDVQVFKPLFILVSAVSFIISQDRPELMMQIAVMASRYAAVFPLSELINWVYHTRGQRHEELPHSYQMMLFWAGLRGAVGVALAAGITGDNADALRTTVLVVVVVTVVVFGGTTARMLEVLGIRVGVEDEDASSDEDDGWSSHHGNLALTMGPGSRRFAGSNGRGLYAEEEGFDSHSPANSPYLPSSDRMPMQTTRRTSGGRPNLAKGISRSGFSASSEDSDDGEPLPAATYGQDQYDGSAGGGPDGAKPGMIFRDGQWFTTLDERYLLPLFSNSVTARRHHASKRAKRASVYNGGESGGGTPREGSLDVSREEFPYDPERESENGKNKLPRTFR